MRVSCLQLNPQAGDPAGNLAQAQEALRQAAAGGAELWLLPEMWASSFCAEVTDPVMASTQLALENLARLSGELGISIAGSAYGPRGAQKPSNRFHLFEDGREVYSYEKGQLFSPTAEHLSFSAGASPPGLVESRLGKLYGVICYDLRFPLWVRPAQRAGAQVMMVVAQWPKERADQWTALAIGRAVEGQCFVVACNRRGKAVIGRRKMELEFPGNSIVVDPSGAVLAQGGAGDLLVDAELDLGLVNAMRKSVPVFRDERK